MFSKRTDRRSDKLTNWRSGTVFFCSDFIQQQKNVMSAMLRIWWTDVELKKKTPTVIAKWCCRCSFSSFTALLKWCWFFSIPFGRLNAWSSLFGGTNRKTSKKLRKHLKTNIRIKIKMISSPQNKQDPKDKWSERP